MPHFFTKDNLPFLIPVRLHEMIFDMSDHPPLNTPCLFCQHISVISQAISRTCCANRNNSKSRFESELSPFPYLYPTHVRIGSAWINTLSNKHTQWSVWMRYNSLWTSTGVGLSDVFTCIDGNNESTVEKAQVKIIKWMMAWFHLACFSFRDLALCMLPHHHAVMADRDSWIDQSHC